MIRSKPFWLLFLSQSLSIFADSMLFLVMLKMIENTSGMGLSFYFILASLPVFLFGLHAGAFVESRTYQKVMATTDFIRVILIISFVSLINILSNDILLVYLFIFLIVTNNVFFSPASSALLPRIVEKEIIVKANSYLRITAMVAKMASYSFVAFLLKVNISLNYILLSTVILYLSSMLLILAIKPYFKREQVENSKLWPEIVQGMKYVRNNVVLIRLFSLFSLAWVVGSSVDIYLISYLNDVLGKGMEDLYLITTFSLVGIAIGSILSPFLYKRMEKKLGFMASIFSFSIVILCFSLKLPLPLLLFLLMLGGISQGIFLIFMSTFLQSYVEGGFLARIFSLYNLILTGASLPGYLLFGYLIEKFGVINTGYMITFYLLLIGGATIMIIPSLGKNMEIPENFSKKAKTN